MAVADISTITKTTTGGATTNNSNSIEQKTPIPVHIPSRPSIRSTASFASTASTNSSSSTHLSEKPVETVTFRHGQVEDAALMTEMQFSNYLYHYRDIAPKIFLDTLDYSKMTTRHVKRMTPPVDEREASYVVAERTSPTTGEPEIIGMSQVMVPDWDRAYNHRFYDGWSQDDFDCEIDTLYVKIGVQGGGLGRKLILGALQEGYDRFNMRRGVIIWTLEGNTQARDFYKRVGCDEVAIRTLDLAGVPSECIGYAFRTVGEAIGK
ncbi:hypothetical protein BC939DRAFT_477035 [Gamsiella multidivaricata]|uniref:uncharacterized protein n=1 Tax=Gamsiella multidivaricata TaxID=101098 RepID=UPI002220F066|nr:uncharacterized protein BC939DRAFT_477035 [Gamsiella multidivaricata]KAG0364140.1 hypothetical protein BGZ54_007810 [Gamsiella multidivaricata]KAI7823871.1 hypothetical protein BC939DRAFT_477035 [Gamsiella multidivaricata]